MLDVWLPCLDKLSIHQRQHAEGLLYVLMQLWRLDHGEERYESEGHFPNLRAGSSTYDKAQSQSTRSRYVLVHTYKRSYVVS
jgi:hypothetical protein